LAELRTQAARQLAQNPGQGAQFREDDPEDVKKFYEVFETMKEIEKYFPDIKSEDREKMKFCKFGEDLQTDMFKIDNIQFLFEFLCAYLKTRILKGSDKITLDPEEF